MKGKKQISMTTANENINFLLFSVNQQLEAVRLARERYAIKLSPGFNCFDYILPDELRLSEIIADLLNPRGKHSQGAKFLSLFLELLSLNEFIAENAIEVKTEVFTFNNRRVDIEIKWPDGRLIIENKPRADDQDNQVHDYIQDLLRSNPNKWHLVYISGSGQAPSSNSISQNEASAWKRSRNLTLTSYENLIIPWIDKCRASCESERFRWFLGEFNLFVLAEFKGEHDMQERQSITEQILKSTDSLRAAIEVSVAIQDVKVSLLQLLEKQLRNLSSKAGWTLDWGVQYGQKWPGFRFLIFPEKEQFYHVSFQFQKLQLRELVFGIIKIDEKLPDKPAIFDVMETANLGFSRSKRQSWWPWFALVNEEIRDWDNSSQPWIKIKDGTLATDIIKIVQTCYDHFASKNKLNLLKK